MSFEMDKIKASKRRMRRHLAALPVESKLRIVEKLRGNGTTALSTPSDQVSEEHPKQNEQNSTLFDIIRHTVEGKPLTRQVDSDSLEERNLAAEVEGIFREKER